jgi:hypothetical protein
MPSLAVGIVAVDEYIDQIYEQCLNNTQATAGEYHKLSLSIALAQAAAQVYFNATLSIDHEAVEELTGELHDKEWINAAVEIVSSPASALSDMRNLIDEKREACQSFLADTSFGYDSPVIGCSVYCSGLDQSATVAFTNGQKEGLREKAMSESEQTGAFAKFSEWEPTSDNPDDLIDFSAKRMEIDPESSLVAMSDLLGLKKYGPPSVTAALKEASTLVRSAIEDGRGLADIQDELDALGDSLLKEITGDEDGVSPKEKYPEISDAIPRAAAEAFLDVNALVPANLGFLGIEAIASLAYRLVQIAALGVLLRQYRTAGMAMDAAGGSPTLPLSKVLVQAAYISIAKSIALEIPEMLKTDLAENTLPQQVIDSLFNEGETNIEPHLTHQFNAETSIAGFMAALVHQQDGIMTFEDVKTKDVAMYVDAFYSAGSDENLAQYQKEED